MKIHKPGSKVLVNGIYAITIAISIKQTGVQYQICYWDGNTRKTEWIEEFELTTISESKTTVLGFKEQ